MLGSLYYLTLASISDTSHIWKVGSKDSNVVSILNCSNYHSIEMPLFSEEGAVNTNLLQTRWENVRMLLEFQRPGYAVSQHQEIRSLICNLPCICEEEVLHALSLASLPPTRHEQAKSTSTLFLDLSAFTSVNQIKQEYNNLITGIQQAGKASPENKPDQEDESLPGHTLDYYQRVVSALETSYLFPHERQRLLSRASNMLYSSTPHLQSFCTNEVKRSVSYDHPSQPWHPSQSLGLGNALQEQ